MMFHIVTKLRDKSSVREAGEFGLSRKYNRSIRLNPTFLLYLSKFMSSENISSIVYRFLFHVFKSRGKLNWHLLEMVATEDCYNTS